MLTRKSMSNDKGPARPPVAGLETAGPAETALRESEARLRAILQTAVEGIITIDELGIVESINPAAEKIFGFSAAEVLGRNVSLLMPSPHREQHDAYIAGYLRSGQAKIVGIGREVIGRRKDGTVFPMDLSVSEVRLADKRLFTGFVRDLTLRRRFIRDPRNQRPRATAHRAGFARWPGPASRRD